MKYYNEVKEKLLSEVGKEYGKNIIKQYSKKLMVEVEKRYNVRTLYRMRKFYELFSSGKLTTMWSKLSWSHYREILYLKDIDEIKYYLDECESKNLTQRQLHELIRQKSYNYKNKFTQRRINGVYIKTSYIK